MYDARAGSPVATLDGHGSWVLGTAHSPDGSHLVTSSADKSVKIWDIGSRQCLSLFDLKMDNFLSGFINSETSLAEVFPPGCIAP